MFLLRVGVISGPLQVKTSAGSQMCSLFDQTLGITCSLKTSLFFDYYQGLPYAILTRNISSVVYTCIRTTPAY